MLKYIFALFLGWGWVATAAQPETEIRINLQGYPSGAPKRALILSKKALKSPQLDLVSAIDHSIRATFNSKKSNSAWEPFPFTYEIDFSSFNHLGEYLFQLKNTDIKSEIFYIGPYPAWQNDVISFIRTQRCGYNPYIKEFCHQLDGLSFFGNRPDSTRIDATGGWHDAGDQLKYLITGSNTTARMLMTFQMGCSSFLDTHDA